MGKCTKSHNIRQCQEGRRKSVMGKCTKSHNIRQCQSHLIDKFTRQRSLDFLKNLFIQFLITKKVKLNYILKV